MTRRKKPSNLHTTSLAKWHLLPCTPLYPHVLPHALRTYRPTRCGHGELPHSQAGAGRAEQTWQSWRMGEPFQNNTPPDLPRFQAGRNQSHSNGNHRLPSGALGAGWRCHMMDNFQPAACRSWSPLFQMTMKIWATEQHYFLSGLTHGVWGAQRRFQSGVFPMNDKQPFLIFHLLPFFSSHAADKAFLSPPMMIDNEA